jgi:hypothetical protein
MQIEFKAALDVCLESELVSLKLAQCLEFQKKVK